MRLALSTVPIHRFGSAGKTQHRGWDVKVQGEGAAIGLWFGTNGIQCVASIRYMDNATVLEIEIGIVARWRAAGYGRQEARESSAVYTRAILLRLGSPRASPNNQRRTNALLQRCRPAKIVASEPAPLFIDTK